MIDEGKPTLEEWLAQAHAFGLDYVEMYQGFLPSKAPGPVSKARKLLDRYDLGVCMMTSAPDFTHPDAAERQRQFDEMVTHLEACRMLGATGLRVTAGCVHEGVSRADGVRWAVEWLSRLAEPAERMGLKLGFENHYRDRRWTDNDFIFHTDVFLDVFEGLRDTPVGANFDCSNQLMTNADPMTVLNVVIDKVWHVHASDRQPGRYAHSVVGEGSVDFDPIFAKLAAHGFSGFISLEDGNPEGDRGTQRGLDFLRSKVREHWA